GTGTCDGAVNAADGTPVQIPCDCPPTQDVYIAALTANVNAGHAVNNTVVAIALAGEPPAPSPSDSTLGPTSTTFVPSSASPPPTSSIIATSSVPTVSAPSSTPTGGSNPPDNETIAMLTPDLGFTAGLNPKGNGNCDGAVRDGSGQPVQVPCSCPPDRSPFVDSVIVNVNAHHIVNNPSIGVQFEVDNTTDALITRLQTAIDTLQNLLGSGIGCPIESTTLSVRCHSYYSSDDLPKHISVKAQMQDALNQQ
ncbi:hypothetical protein OF83DRAFT_1059983, partial [Amylostereum chailletii]